MSEVNDPSMILSDMIHCNPLWFFNHLDKETQGYILEHLDDILKESEKYGIHYTAVLDTVINGQPGAHVNLSKEAFTPVRHLVRMMETRTKKEVPKFSMPTSKSPTDIMIASDYARMGEFINDEIGHPERTIRLIRALSSYTFTGLGDVVNIINSAGTIAECDSSTSLYHAFSLVSDTLDMLFRWLDLIKYPGHDYLNTIEATVKASMDTLDNVEGYFSGDLSEYEDKCHVTSYLINLATIYMICVPTLVVPADKDLMVTKIKSGYLYRRIQTQYYRDRDTLEKMLDDIIELSINSNSVTELYTHALAKEYTILMNKSHAITGDTSIEPNDTSDNRSSDLSISKQVEIDSLKRITEDDIADAICSKLGFNRDAVNVIPFGDVSEELLAMYLAEFNATHPLVIFPKDDHYYINWEGMYYLLFELDTKLGDVKNCLYAIRIVEDDLSKKYDIIQFKKCDTVKYVFEY